MTTQDPDDMRRFLHRDNRQALEELVGRKRELQRKHADDLAEDSEPHAKQTIDDLPR